MKEYKDETNEEIPDILHRLLDDLEDLDKLFEDFSEESDLKKFEEINRKIIDGVYKSTYNKDINVVPGWGSMECKSVLLVWQPMYPYLHDPFWIRELMDLEYYEQKITNKNYKNIRPRMSVSIGGNFQDLLLRVAAEHMKNCKGITKYVVFYTSYWDSELWLSYRSYFRSVNVILKMIMSKHTYLKV